MALGRRIAVLSKKDLPYGRWLAPSEVVVFAEDGPTARAHCADPATGYAPERLFTDWKRNRTVDTAVATAHRDTPFDRIVALSECDQVRAGELRDALGIAGLGAAGAGSFRDKLVMKRHVARAGLAVPAFAAVHSPWDVVDFACEHSRIVVKPVDGAGSQGVRVLGSTAEIRAWLAARPVDGDEPARHLVEEHVDAPMLVVDGIMAGGRMLVGVVSRYSTSCYDQLTRLLPQGTVHLATDDPARLRALTFTGQVIRALPGPTEPTSFHCELFDDPRRGLLLCEMAARTGGCLFNQAARCATGVDLEQWSCLGQAGVASDELPAGGGVGFGGYVVAPGPGRVLEHAPERCPVDGVREYQVHASPGEFVPAARKSSQNVVEILFPAPDARRVAAIHDEVLDWLGTQVRWR